MFSAVGGCMLIFIGAFYLHLRNISYCIVMPTEKVNLWKYSRHISDDLSHAIVAGRYTKDPDAYFIVKQLSSDQSVLRFGIRSDAGIAEHAYQVRVCNQSVADYDLYRMSRTQMMWNCSVETNWPQITFDSQNVSPYFPHIVSFRVLCRNCPTSGWTACDWDSRVNNAMPDAVMVVMKAISPEEAKKTGASNLSENRYIYRDDVTVIFPVNSQ